FLVFDRVLSRTTALVATGLAALATSTWAVSADALWGHGIAQLWLACALLALTWRRPGIGQCVAGLSFALAITVRPHLAVVAAVIGLALAWRTRSVLPAVRIGVTSALGLLALLIYNSIVFDQLTLFPATYSNG